LSGASPGVKRGGTFVFACKLLECRSSGARTRGGLAIGAPTILWGYLLLVCWSPLCRSVIDTCQPASCVEALQFCGRQVALVSGEGKASPSRCQPQVRSCRVSFLQDHSAVSEHVQCSLLQHGEYSHGRRIQLCLSMMVVCCIQTRSTLGITLNSAAGLPARVRVPVLPSATSRLIYELLGKVRLGFLVVSPFRIACTFLHWDRSSKQVWRSHRIID
jgi:hypothetical protein